MEQYMAGPLSTVPVGRWPGINHQMDNGLGAAHLSFHDDSGACCLEDVLTLPNMAETTHATNLSQHPVANPIDTLPYFQQMSG